MNTYTTDHIFFTEDGTFGLALTLQVFDTELWTYEDWEEVRECADSERMNIAEQINNKYNKGKQQ